MVPLTALVYDEQMQNSGVFFGDQLPETWWADSLRSGQYALIGVKQFMKMKVCSTNAFVEA
jgi:hypothetical protein